MPFAGRPAVDGTGWKGHAGVVGRLRERERELAAVEVLLEHRGGMLVLEGRAGIGKTSLVEVACSRADELGHEVVRARGSELESGFAFGVVRQLFERRLAGAGKGERAALLAGPAAAVRPLLSGEFAVAPAGDSWFAVLHGLYWLVVNLAARRPLLIAVDDAHWADEPSLRWLAYLAPRLEGLAGGRGLACCWNRRCWWPPARASAPRSPWRWPLPMRLCSGGWSGGLTLRAGDCLGVVVDGEVGAGVAVAGACLRGGVGEQRPGQRDAVPGELGDDQVLR